MTAHTYRRIDPLEQRYRRLRLRPVSPRITRELSTANDRTLDAMHRDWWWGDAAPWIIVVDDDGAPGPGDVSRGDPRGDRGDAPGRPRWATRRRPRTVALAVPRTPDPLPGIDCADKEPPVTEPTPTAPRCLVDPQGAP